MKLHKIIIENFRNISSLETNISDFFVITGKNGSGKSSVLDAIFGAIKGKTYFKADPAKLIKIGEDKAIITLVVGDENKQFTIERKISGPTESSPEGNMTLKVVNEEGFKADQKTLDNLLSSFTIDPLMLVNQKPKEQIETLKNIAGIDTTQIEEEARIIYDKRTIENRELTRLKSNILEDVEKVEKVSISDLLNERNLKLSKNKEIDNKIQDRDNLKSNINENNNKISEYEDLIKNLKETNELLEKQYKIVDNELFNLEKFDINELDEKISNTEKINEKARRYEENELNKQNYKKQEDICNKLDEDYKNKLKEREELIKNSNLPDYVTFDKNNGVLINGIPFSELNTAEQIKKSIELGSILNPQLKVLYIKDGSLLDEDNLKTIKEVIEKTDYQILIERVGEDTDGSIIMREGKKIN